MENLPKKVSKTQLSRTINTNERKNVRLILNELTKSNSNITDLCEIFNVEEDRFKYIISKKGMAQEYLDALEIQKKLNTNEILNKSLTALTDMIEGKSVEEVETWEVDANGIRTLKSVKNTKKAPSYSAIEKALKTFAPAKFSDKLKPEQIYSIFLAFNNFLSIECGRPEVAAELHGFMKDFIIKISN